MLKENKSSADNFYNFFTAGASLMGAALLQGLSSERQCSSLALKEEVFVNTNIGRKIRFDTLRRDYKPKDFVKHIITQRSKLHCCLASELVAVSVLIFNSQICSLQYMLVKFKTLVFLVFNGAFLLHKKYRQHLANIVLYFPGAR